MRPPGVPPPIVSNTNIKAKEKQLEFVLRIHVVLASAIYTFESAVLSSKGIRKRSPYVLAKNLSSNARSQR